MTLRDSLVNNPLGLTRDQRWEERLENIDPPSDEPFRNLACAVIYSAAKDWSPIDKGSSAGAEYFFNSEDYLFWSSIADIRTEGPAIVRALRENGGVSRTWTNSIFD